MYVNRGNIFRLKTVTNNSDSFDRLDKILSHKGFGTRRDIKYLVHDKAVTVNGTVVTDAGMKICFSSDEVNVNGEPVPVQEHIYLMMNKPQNFVSASKDGLHQTVFDLLDEKYRTSYLTEHLHLIGRLDIDTEGLLLFTTDGVLTHRIISPKTHLPKTYLVRLGTGTDNVQKTAYIEHCAEGIHIVAEGNEAEADCRSAVLVWDSSVDNQCTLTITEGKYHQVKRMFAALGNEVVYLNRISIGRLQLDPSLACGAYRELLPEEITLLE
jgi:16S rRNA pseudouridine516 synthase